MLTQGPLPVSSPFISFSVPKLVNSLLIVSIRLEDRRHCLRVTALFLAKLRGNALPNATISTIDTILPMKTNTPHNAKTNQPNSDESARSKHPDSGDEAMPDVSDDIDGLQTSNKSGKHSSVEKLAASRPEFGAGRGAQPVSGAFGKDPDHVVTGRLAGPNTNQFHCESCGRDFNTAQELSTHEPECRLAKAATAAGRASLT